MGTNDSVPDDSYLINSIIGENTRFEGNIHLKGILRIDGDFKGSVVTRGKVFIGKNGRTESNLRASTIIIGGIVKGNVYASEKVVILATGMVLGNITAPKLVIEDGVILNGKCEISDKAVLVDFEDAHFSLYKPPVFETKNKPDVPAEKEQVSAEHQKYNPMKSQPAHKKAGVWTR